MMYTYKFMTTVTETIGLSSQTTLTQVQAHIPGQLEDLGNRLSEMVSNVHPGDWDVVSHSTTSIGQFLIVSFLLRRPQ